MMYLAGGGFDIKEEYNYDPHVLTSPEGNYTGLQMAAAIQELLNGFNVTFDFEVLYHLARGTFTIDTKSENMAEHAKFYIPGDLGIMTWMSSANNNYPWRDRQGLVTTVDNNNLHSTNGVLRNSDMIAVNLQS